MRAVDAILAAMTPNDGPAAVAVVDESRELVYSVRMDGASAFTARQALRCAYSAAFMERDTSSFATQMLTDGRDLGDWADDMLTSLEGGVTVRYNGSTVGGIGVTGTLPERDDELAQIGLTSLGLESAKRPQRP